MLRPVAQPASEQGFTLFELLLTLALCGSGLFALVQTLSQGVQAKSDSEDIVQAIALAQGVLEDYRDRTRTVAAWNSIVSASTAPVSGFPSFTTNVKVSFPLGQAGNNARLKQVDVTVGWQAQGTVLTTSLSTYIARQ